jgi:hypothetical protein
MSKPSTKSTQLVALMPVAEAGWYALFYYYPDPDDNDTYVYEARRLVGWGLQPDGEIWGLIFDEGCSGVVPVLATRYTTPRHGMGRRSWIFDHIFFDADFPLRTHRRQVVTDEEWRKYSKSYPARLGD